MVAVGEAARHPRPGGDLPARDARHRRRGVDRLHRRRPPGPLGQGDEGGTWHDARSPLVLEVLRWVLAVQPANICLEQVPDVLPFWELIARWLRTQGYSVWTGCLSSERYGVPQTRERAILIASRERAVSAPPATHTAYDSRLADGGKWHGTDGDLFGGGLEPWVSMAEALEWVPQRPS
jgi:DNA (cytosine-5)-methyltransferase 1